MMDYFNIIYEDDTDDADIICVPAELSERMDDIAQEFLDWLPNADENDELYWTVYDGHKCISCETEGFMKWLNKNYCYDMPEARIVEQHVHFCGDYDAIEF